MHKPFPSSPHDGINSEGFTNHDVAGYFPVVPPVHAEGNKSRRYGTLGRVRSSRRDATTS